MLAMMFRPSVGYLGQKGHYSVERFVCPLEDLKEVGVLGTCLGTCHISWVLTARAYVPSPHVHL